MISIFNKIQYINEEILFEIKINKFSGKEA